MRNASQMTIRKTHPHLESPELKTWYHSMLYKRDKTMKWLIMRMIVGIWNVKQVMDGLNVLDVHIAVVMIYQFMPKQQRHH